MFIILNYRKRLQDQYCNIHSTENYMNFMTDKGESGDSQEMNEDEYNALYNTSIDLMSDDDGSYGGENLDGRGGDEGSDEDGAGRGETEKKIAIIIILSNYDRGWNME